jgi:hypothetical protein
LKNSRNFEGNQKKETVFIYQTRITPTMSSAVVAAGNRLIEARRRQDNAYKEMEGAIDQDRKVTHMAHFEIKTSSKIDKRNRHVSLCLYLFISSSQCIYSRQCWKRNEKSMNLSYWKDVEG